MLSKTKTFYSKITLKYSLTNFARKLYNTESVTKPIEIEETLVKDKYDEFCQKFDLKFSDSNLIHQICTHKSVRSVNAPTNERLDFLGEKVIQLYTVEYFINKISPEKLKGQIKLYAHDLNKLGKIGINLGLNKLLYWTPINEIEMAKAKKKGREVPPPSGEESVSGKSLRALVGAIYHDKGTYAAKNFIYKYILPTEEN